MSAKWVIAPHNIFIRTIHKYNGDTMRTCQFPEQIEGDL